MGVNAFAVATIEEGICLRSQGITGEILILGYTDVRRAEELERCDLTQTLIDLPYARALEGRGVKVKAHLKVDTGMHRLGIDWEDVSGAGEIFAMENLNIRGIYTHLCCADSRKPGDEAFTREQIGRFYRCIGSLKSRGIAIPKVHIQSSYGLLNYPELSCDYVRAGIALYGVLSSPGDNTRLNLDLRPVLSLKARVVSTRRIKAGEFFGYGRRYEAKRDGRVAMLPVGYGDGFPRNLSRKGAVAEISGQYFPVIGSICMDQLAIDITAGEGISPGAVATLIGDGGEVSAPFVAGLGGSISNELLCRMGRRLPVVVK